MEENNFIDSKFRQVILAAKRARQLLMGSKRKIDFDAENPLTIAMEELKQGKIDFKVLLNKEAEGLENGLELAEAETKSDDESVEELDSEVKAEEDEPSEKDPDSEEVSPQLDPE